MAAATASRRIARPWGFAVKNLRITRRVSIADLTGTIVS